MGVVGVGYRHPGEALDAGDERDHGAPGSDPADGGASTFARAGIESVYRDRPCRHFQHPAGMTQRYAHLRAEDLGESVGVLDNAENSAARLRHAGPGKGV